MLPLAQAHVDRADKPHMVYEFYDRDGEPVYVGCTYDLPARLRTHMRSDMWREVDEIRAHLFPDRHLARNEEGRLIVALQPRWNFQQTEEAAAFAREDHARRKAARAEG